MSQADLWLRRTLIIDQPLHDEFTWRWANWTLTPFGYRPGETGGTMVPVYGPGLPILMAMFKAIGGQAAVFFVVPLVGALAICLTYRLGLRFGDQQSAALAALALAVSPIFLSRLVWPMSDIPATFWWLAAIVLALDRSTVRTVLAGAAAAAAILTRPNLVPLVAVVALLILAHDGVGRAGIRRVAVFTVAMLPGLVAVAVLNNHLYGSPIASGYGTVETIYAGRYFLTNLVRYPVWLVETQPFLLLACAAPFLLRRDGRTEATRLSILALVLFAGVLLLYLFYTPYEDREFLRFLLPGFPMMLAAASAAFGALAPKARVARTAMFVSVALALAAAGVWQARGAFLMRDVEARYRVAAQFAASLPEDALFLCNLHSGSLRYYANRVTLRFEWLEPDVYVDALRQVRQSGRPLFVVLDDVEREIFRARYAPVADVSWLDRPPTLLAAKRVYFYQLW